MITAIAFVGAVAAMVVAYEIGSRILAPLSVSRLDAPREAGYAVSEVKTPSLWDAILLAAFPGWFGRANPKRTETVVDLLRRAGYPFDSPGSFYAFAIRVFTQDMILLALFSAVVVLLGFPEFILPLGALMVYDGLTRPYNHLKALIRVRNQAFRNNLLAGLSTLQSLLAAGVGVQEAMRRTAEVGGPFCNLLLLLVTRMEIEPFDRAMEAVRKHLPDPNDIEVNLFLRDVEAYFTNNRPLLPGVTALQKSVHRLTIEETEKRASLIKQRAGLFGILAVVGMMITLILPFLFAL